MHLHRIVILVITVLLSSSLLLGAMLAFVDENQHTTPWVMLDNVRDYTTATSRAGIYYAVDGGALYTGGPSQWAPLALPRNVIASTVDADGRLPSRIYVGVAGELAIYRSDDSGQNWQRFPLAEHMVGSITDIAVDSFQKLVYVGTDSGNVFRLRETGSQLVVGSRLIIDEPILQLVADQSGSGLVFARTPSHLYRADQYGLAWVVVDNLGATPTSVAMRHQAPTTVYVGTTDAGILQSRDGHTWTSIAQTRGGQVRSRVTPLPRIDALATDSVQTNYLYVASRRIVPGTDTSSQKNLSEIHVALYDLSSRTWTQLGVGLEAEVTDLIPVSGQPGMAYALTTASRQPVALGRAPLVGNVNVSEPVVPSRPSWNWTAILAWTLAGLAIVSFFFAVTVDLRQRRRRFIVGGALLIPIRSERN